MRIAVAGGSGLLGRFVVDAAQRQSYQVVVLSRSNGIDIRSGQALESALDGVAAPDLGGPEEADLVANSGPLNDASPVMQGAPGCRVRPYNSDTRRAAGRCTGPPPGHAPGG